MREEEQMKVKPWAKNVDKVYVIQEKRRTQPMTNPTRLSQHIWERAAESPKNLF